MLCAYKKKSADDVFDTSEGALPLDFQRIAEEELGETPQRRKEALEELMQLLSEEPELKANTDIKFLLRFLRVRKYNVNSALQTIRNYYWNRAYCVSIYRELVPRKVPPAGRKLVTVLPYKDVHGRPIILLKPNIWLPDELPYVDFQRAWTICMEHVAADPASQVLGVVLMLDFYQYTADKLLSVSLGLMRRALEYIQDCIPMRLKAVHIVKESYAFDVFYALIRPFLKAKLRERFLFHGENFERLHEEISPEALPEEYGGQGPPIDHDAFWSQMDAVEEDFTAASRFGYPMKEEDDLPADTTEQLEIEDSDDPGDFDVAKVPK